MIKIEAKQNGESTELQMKINGKGDVIFNEATAILAHFQLALMKSNPRMFSRILEESTKLMMEHIKEEVENAGTDTRELS